MQFAETLRRCAGALLPPIVAEPLRRWRRRHTGLMPSSYVGNYQNYAHALADCNSDLGYQDSAIVQNAIDRAKTYTDSLTTEIHLRETPILSALLRPILHRSGHLLRIADFGGGAAVHYHQVRRFLPDQIQLAWDIIETPAMANACRQQINEPGLRFLTAPDLDQPYDAVLASGVLPCLPNPDAQLAEFAAWSRFVILNRIRLLPDEWQDRQCIQRLGTELGGGAYPFRFFAKHRLTELMGKQAQILMQWESWLEPIRLDGQLLSEHGFLLENRPE